ncbi:MAG: thiamine biosynthesis protein ApbE [Flavobacteriaceae bacterium CG_4_8_14_3_um_filter_34_10]|nr:FAD:protein FMN transferase [Flavobacteriia bacterium]OIP49860.1 MAG: thiamine biosynthesis protein ApbE [Flavobacteriaceae bacterium CG2_30_34_30]PIQ18838.1 MAG: thiamine biosynthesis protein ApbE [Flavobacteriaceae bacterium CG18_big_fil_WC_8_21_14_2_50_34_36]PIV50980.1 MAG: thiamine biosynthesis protein ApbE [Flavobacteriaceae bacterium CG02_land_8_20_14_3_00_34_13]PIX10511.1 MAG: thiamine biosynthesis protein ApbE [Flavobacteriaceae bacterium CG_4_8_14_3_um_filter_34_10]PIZ07438.1 MAG: 
MNKVLLISVLLFAGALQAQQTYQKTTKLMGSRFDLTVVAKNEAEGNYFITMAIEEISRIEKLISSWDSNSQTSQINRNAGIKEVKVDEELFDLIDRSIKISKLTDGAFDISFASMEKIWKFDGSMTEKPSEEAIAKSVEKIGYKNIILNKEKHTVFLKNEGMKIGFGAIGKGYAADKTKALLIEKGVSAGIINASGDMNTWGKQPDGTSWMVAITNPLNKEKVFSWLPIDNSAIVTSGNYEKFIVFDNIRYSHIINPRTGYPATGIISATILSSSAEVADALATAVFVMGIEVGLDFINQLKGVECILIDEDNKIFTSNHIQFDKK